MTTYKIKRVKTNVVDRTQLSTDMRMTLYKWEGYKTCSVYIEQDKKTEAYDVEKEHLCEIEVDDIDIARNLFSILKDSQLFCMMSPVTRNEFVGKELSISIKP